MTTAGKGAGLDLAQMLASRRVRHLSAARVLQVGGLLRMTRDECVLEPPIGSPDNARETGESPRPLAISSEPAALHGQNSKRIFRLVLYDALACEAMGTLTTGSRLAIGGPARNRLVTD